MQILRIDDSMRMVYTIDGGDTVGKTSVKAVAKYNAKAYDRIELKAPKGNREILQAAAAAAGESVNTYITAAVLQRMGLDDWPVKSLAQQRKENETE